MMLPLSYLPLSLCVHCLPFLMLLIESCFTFQVMCVQYWPAGKNREEVYSGVGVTVENEEQLANFMIRTIRLRKVIFVENEASLKINGLFLNDLTEVGGGGLPLL